MSTRKELNYSHTGDNSVCLDYYAVEVAYDKANFRFSIQVGNIHHHGTVELPIELLKNVVALGESQKK